MAVETIFAVAGMIIILGFLGDLLFSKTNIPDVLFLIAIGAVLGPILGYLEPASLGGAASIFTSFALLFILFEGGLHIRIKDLMKSMYGATVITVVNFILTVAVIFFIAKAFGWESSNALLLGTILGGTSSAVVVPIVKRLQMSSTNSLVLILESAFTDVLCIVGTLAIVQILTIESVIISGVLNSLFGSFAIAIFIGGVAGFLWILLLEKFETLGKSYMSSIGILLLIFGITELAQASGAIAGLTFGIIMGNSRKILSLAEGAIETDPISSSARAFFSQISFFVKTFFFVYIGLLLSLTELTPVILGILITAAVFFIRPISVALTLRSQDHYEDRAIMESMVPKGLAAAVLAQIPLQMGIPGAEKIVTPVIAVIFFTIVMTTLLVSMTKYFGFKGITYWALSIIGKKPKPSAAIVSNPAAVKAEKATAKRQLNAKKNSKPNQKKALK